MKDCVVAQGIQNYEWCSLYYLVFGHDINISEQTSIFVNIACFTKIRFEGPTTVSMARKICSVKIRLQNDIEKHHYHRV